MVYNDPWFHDDSHEPYNSLPNRGYAMGDDPLETRYNYSNAIYYSLMIILAVTLIGSFTDDNLGHR
jgi:hypothetical protein